MNNGKRYIFFDTLSGEVLLTEARNRIEIMPSIERTIDIHSILSGRNRETFDILELTFVEYAEDFQVATSYRVNPITKQLEFSYPDPNAPGEPQPYIKPLSETVNENMDYLVDVDFRLSMVELGL